MHILPTELKYYVEIAKTEAVKHWKPTVAIAGIALVIVKIWNEKGLAVLALVSVVTLRVVGPKSLHPTSHRIFLVTALLTNGCFGFINQTLLGVGVAVLLVEEEVRSWFLASRLADQNKRLKGANEELDSKVKEVSQHIISLNDALHTCVQASEEADKKAPATAQVIRDYNDVVSLAKKLKGVCNNLMKNDFVRERVELIEQLNSSYKKKLKLLQGVTQEVENVKNRISTAIDHTETLSLQKGRHIEELKKIIEILTSLTRSNPC